MKAATINQLKKTLVKRDPGEVLEACLRLARFKRDNKELLTYLLFASQDEQAYVNDVCQEIDELFSEINRTTMYYAKKGIRKIVRRIDKCIKYSGVKESEVEIRLYFCRKLEDSGIRFRSTKVTYNMFLSQLSKIEKVITKFHDDIQSEYRRELRKLSES